MAFNPFQDPIRRWAERSLLWLNRFMQDDSFSRGVLVEPAGIGADGQRRPKPRVLLAVRRPEDAAPYLTSILAVNPLPQDVTVHFVETLPNAVYGKGVLGFFQDIFSPNDGAGASEDLVRQGEINTKIAEGRATALAKEREQADAQQTARVEARGKADAARMEKQALADKARIEARGKADAARTASQSLAAQSRADARDARIRDIGTRDAGWITAQGDAMQARRTAWSTAATKAMGQTRADRRARRAESSEADFKLAEEARTRAAGHHRTRVDARARERATLRTDVTQRAQDEAKERQRIRLKGQNARREARITDATDRVTDRITGREARLKARRDEALSNEQGWLDLLLGTNKARGEAWQHAITDGLRTAITGRKERQVLRTDAQVARRTERERRKALIAKAGKGWRAPDTTPSAAEPPTPVPEAVAGLFPSFGVIFEDDAFGGSIFPDRFGAEDVFGGGIFPDHFGAESDDGFDPKALVLRTIEKTRDGTLPAPKTWTLGLSGSALTLGRKLTDWVVKHVVSPVENGTWDAVVLAGAAASKGEIESALKRAEDQDRAKVAAAIDRVLA
jgi:hypothetical protein